MKTDEKLFAMNILCTIDKRIPVPIWTYLTKREVYILDKWSGKGWWDYGVTLRSGWLTEKGINELLQTLALEEKQKVLK